VGLRRRVRFSLVSFSPTGNRNKSREDHLVCERIVARITTTERHRGLRIATATAVLFPTHYALLMRSQNHDRKSMDILTRVAPQYADDANGYAKHLAEHWDETDRALVDRGWRPGNILALMLDIHRRAGLPIPVGETKE